MPQYVGDEVCGVGGKLNISEAGPLWYTESESTHRKTNIYWITDVDRRLKLHFEELRYIPDVFWVPCSFPPVNYQIWTQLVLTYWHLTATAQKFGILQNFLEHFFASFRDQLFPMFFSWICNLGRCERLKINHKNRINQ